MSGVEHSLSNLHSSEFESLTEVVPSKFDTLQKYSLAAYVGGLVTVFAAVNMEILNDNSVNQPILIGGAVLNGIGAASSIIASEVRRRRS